MRKIGIASDAYMCVDHLEASFQKMAEHGYQSADYQDFVDIDTPFFALPEAKFEEQVLKEKRAADKAGIEFYQTHSPWRYPPKDDQPEEREIWREAMKKAIWGTSLLGSRYMVIHPIMPYGPDDDPEPEKFWEMNLEFMESLRPTARQYGVKLCLENMPMLNLSISRVEPTYRMVKELGEDDFGVCLDTGHAAVFGDDPGDMVRLLGKSLKVLHVHDNNGHNDLHWLPFNGVINWESFKSALAESESEAVVSIETSVKKMIPACLQEENQKALANMAKYLAGQL